MVVPKRAAVVKIVVLLMLGSLKWFFVYFSDQPSSIFLFKVEDGSPSPFLFFCLELLS